MTGNGMLERIQSDPLPTVQGDSPAGLPELYYKIVRPAQERRPVRYLILSDIHSNLEAFERCVAMASGRYDQVLCLGDLVGYGPDPNAVVDAVRGLASVTIRGNHDKACAGITDAEDFNPLARAGTLWTRQQLTAANLTWLQDLPPGPCEVAGFELVHGSPRDEDEYLVESDDTPPAFEEASSALVFFGHTHLQGGFVWSPDGNAQPIPCYGLANGSPLALHIEEGSRYLVNPGSVGQPRDRDWRAAFAIFDSDQRLVEYYRASYNLLTTQDKMKKAGLPEPLITRLQFGR